MNTLVYLSEEKLQKIAGLLDRCTRDDVCAYMNMTRDELDQLVDLNPEFRRVRAERVAVRQERHEQLDTTWDDIERKTITRIAQTVDSCTDPEYLLKAARVANQAKRREEADIHAARASQAHVSVNVAFRDFINRIGEGVRDAVQTSTAHKDHNVLSLGAFERMAEVIDA